MLQWLSGGDNTKWSPNENYARELMESSSPSVPTGAPTPGGRHPRGGPGPDRLDLRLGR